MFQLYYSIFYDPSDESCTWMATIEKTNGINPDCHTDRVTNHK